MLNGCILTVLNVKNLTIFVLQPLYPTYYATLKGNLGVGAGKGQIQTAVQAGKQIWNGTGKIQNSNKQVKSRGKEKKAKKHKHKEMAGKKAHKLMRQTGKWWQIGALKKGERRIWQEV